MKLDMLTGGWGGGGVNPAAILNTFDFPTDPVKLYKFNWTEELRFFQCEITSREEYPKDGDTKKLTIK